MNAAPSLLAAVMELSDADRFWNDTRFHEISEQPQRFSFIHQERGLRRVRLRKFPRLVWRYQTDGDINLTCVKHERRHPSFGITRR